MSEARAPAGGSRRARRPAGVRNRILELRWVRAADLLEHPLNWRRHSAKQRRAMRALLKEIGYADVLLARQTADGSLVVIDGHLRRSLDADQVVPVLVLDLDEEEAEKLLATHDPIAALAEADPAILGELLGRVKTSSAAVRDLLADLARRSHIPLVGHSDPDDIPVVPAKPRTRPGGLWLMGEHRVLCGDAADPKSYERVLGGNQADILWTDPPYGVNYTGKTSRALTIRNDDASGLQSLLERSFMTIDQILEPGAPIYVCHPAGSYLVTFAKAFIGPGWQLRQTLVWVKNSMVLGHGDYHYRHEGLFYGYKPGPGRRGRGHDGWYGGDAETSVFEIARPPASREHPTAKPTELVRRCLKNSAAPEDLVLDPFCGSGTTIIAAEQCGRRACGIELDPRYVDVIVDRWQAFTGLRARKG